MTRSEHRRKGFTLLETLYVIIILSLATAAGATAVSAVLSIRNELIRVANAETLASTVTELVADELRFGQQITGGTPADGVTPPAGPFKSIKLNSVQFGTGAELCLAEGIPAEDVSRDTDADNKAAAQKGHLLAVTTDSGGSTKKYRELLGARSYHDLHLSKLEFTLTAAVRDITTSKVTTPAQITVALAVADENDYELYATEFKVDPLNGLA